MFKVITEIGGNGTCAGIKALNDRLKIASKVSHNATSGHKFQTENKYIFFRNSNEMIHLL